MNEKTLIFSKWTHRIRMASDGLSVWLLYLEYWTTVDTIPDEEFMVAVQNLEDLGLLEWLDASGDDLDKLREIMTVGGEG